MNENVTKKEFQVISDLSEIQKASSRVLSLVKPLDLNESCLFDIRLCLEEALINAIKYGNRLKKDLKVRLAVEFNKDEVRITVEDQGKGFDPQQLKNCTAETNLSKNHGRGVYLIHHLMDDVRYNSKGNSILMVKKLKGRR